MFFATLKCVNWHYIVGYYAGLITLHLLFLFEPPQLTNKHNILAHKNIFQWDYGMCLFEINIQCHDNPHNLFSSLAKYLSNLTYNYINLCHILIEKHNVLFCKFCSLVQTA